MPGDIILLYIHVYHKWRSYDIWFLKYKVRQTEVFVILGYFLLFQPPDNPENQNFKIENNTWTDIIILHIWTINNNQMIYGSWEKECYRDNFLSFWTVFCPFTPYGKKKKKEKNIWRYYNFINVYHKWHSYYVWILRYGVQQT